MAVLTEFNCFTGDLAKAIHDLQASGHTIKVALTNTLPVVTNTVFANITEITAENGYVAGGLDIQNDLSESSGTASLTGVDTVFTASGGTIGPFRYAVLYNDTATNKNLIGFTDYGSSITLNDGETFTVDFGATIIDIASV